MKRWMSLFFTGLGVLTLGACAGTVDKLKNVGQPPPLSTIENPQQRQGYQPVSLPMPNPNMVEPQMNSLWQEGRKTFFKDQRASDVGDILTVVIDIDEEATFENDTQRSRSSTEGANIPAFGGLETELDKFLPEEVDPTNLAQFSSDTSTIGSGEIEREEEVRIRLAALVTQMLPNGNMVIEGRQELRVNFEVRELQVMGVIRPEDITIDNSIAFDKIAEARISYGGRGHITDMQQPRYGQQVYDILFPF